MQATIARKDAEIGNLKTELAGIRATQSEQIEVLTTKLEEETKRANDTTAKLEDVTKKVRVGVGWASDGL